MSKHIKLGSMLIVIAAAPLPLLLFVGWSRREDLAWLFIVDLVVAILAAAATRWAASSPPETSRHWAFERSVDP